MGGIGIFHLARQKPRRYTEVEVLMKSFSQNRKINKSSRTQMFFKIVVLKIFADFTVKNLCWSLFLINLPT